MQKYVGHHNFQLPTQPVLFRFLTYLFFFKFLNNAPVNLLNQLQQTFYCYKDAIIFHVYVFSSVLLVNFFWGVVVRASEEEDNSTKIFYLLLLITIWLGNNKNVFAPVAHQNFRRRRNCHTKKNIIV